MSSRSLKRTSGSRHFCRIDLTRHKPLSTLDHSRSPHLARINLRKLKPVRPHRKSRVRNFLGHCMSSSPGKTPFEESKLTSRGPLRFSSSSSFATHSNINRNALTSQRIVYRPLFSRRNPRRSQTSQIVASCRASGNK